MLSSTANTTHQDPFLEEGDSHEIEDTPSLAVSAMTSAAPSAPKSGRVDRKEVIKFNVRNPKRENGTFHSITYFPIEVEVLVENNDAFTLPVVPQPEYLNNAGLPHLQRNNLTKGHSLVVERRYSDVLLLHNLLSYQFPHLVLPPLQPKSLLNHMETYFNAKFEVCMQRESLQFFLQELSIVPDVIFFAPFVARFFTEERDTFQSVVRPEMQSALSKYESRSNIVRCYSKRRNGGGQNAADRIAAQSTSVIRSFVSYFSSGGDSSYANTDSYMFDFDTTNAEESGLPPDAQRWLRVGQKLMRREAHLKKSASSFETYLRAMDGRAKSQQEVKACLHDLGHTFEEEDDRQGLSYIFRDVGQFFQSAVDMETKYIQSKYVNVVFRLECERLYVASALDAIDHILCLYTRTVRVSGIPDTERQVAERLSTMLRAHYEGVYLKYYRIRMQHMSEVQLSRDWKNLATQCNEMAKLYLGKVDEDRSASR